MEILEWMESNKERKKLKLTELKYFDLYFVSAICLITFLAGIIYVLMSKTVYYWDSATYWDISKMLAAKEINWDFFKQVYHSIGTDDYNQFIAVPVVFWMKIFGVTRVSYVASIMFFYLIPTEIVIYFLAKKIAYAPKFAFVITLMSIPALWYLTVIGFIDVSGVLVGLLCYFLYMTDFLDKPKYLKSIILGILLVLIMVMRRYFAFFSVSFITLMILDTIIIKQNYKELFLTLLIVGLLLFGVFNTFTKNILLQNYGAMYSSYKYSFETDLKLITRYFGVIFIIASLISIFVSLIKRREIKGIFALLQVIVCATMFVSTQTHGQQHLLMYVPALVVSTLMMVNLINKKRVFFGVCLLATLNLFSPSVNRVQPQNIQEIKSLAMFPSYSVKPQKRKDINSLLSIKRNLDKKIPEGSTCGILSSSFTLNSSILLNVVPSLNMTELREDSYIVGLPEVDSRDYWRLHEIYECDYVLVATPAQTHLAPGEQTIITEAVASFQNNTDIAQSFSLLKDFKFRLGDIDVRLYKRISDVTETAKTEYEMRLYK